jgi:hypothetical protein
MPGGPTAPAGRPGVDRQNFVSNPQFFPGFASIFRFADTPSIILQKIFFVTNTCENFYEAL